VQSTGLRQLNGAADTSVAIAGAESISDRLNSAPNPAESIPPGEICAFAGRGADDIVQTIRDAVARQFFPGSHLPDLASPLPEGVVAYARLEASAQFAIPFFDSRQPLNFFDSTGATEVRAFGIRSEDKFKSHEMRAQVDVLYVTPEDERKDDLSGPDEFVLDLSSSSQPNQLIVARIAPRETLAATLAAVDVLVERGQSFHASMRSFGPNDVLLVPEMLWRIEHRFAELQGNRIAGGALDGLEIEGARQDIRFRLDRSGAELRSEAAMEMAPIPTHYVLDRPFLLIMKKRDAPRPFLVIWVDNAELLRPFE
jgi:hypothetical protein